ncbi:ABC transporter ATP-binding protein [Bdellovibrio sp. SKB1291214]|uniref:ABC transporter ATP-binding protein n=1 Tax=Bdellovibrio sp. SKB1291214 TaxID=1732569 RepID=UPI000B51C729|nr:ABC transporter ATP-binding protein [Bdellovibrio sp. SKB1291214]
MQPPIISAENLSVYYGSIQALKGITFHVNKGEIVSLIGANGAGKTTTLRALSGLVPSQGNITLHGKNLQVVPTHERVKLGIAQSPEGRGVFAQMSVLENLEMGAYHRSDKDGIKKDFEMCLELFPRIKERLWQMAGTLSGGEQQMLAICRALMCKPEILLLDEPSLGLAPLIVNQIFEIITKLNQDGMTILLVEQNARLALRISHRAYVLETGRVVMQDSGINLLNNDEVRKSYLGV